MTKEERLQNDKAYSESISGIVIKRYEYLLDENLRDAYDPMYIVKVSSTNILTDMLYKLFSAFASQACLIGNDITMQEAENISSEIVKGVERNLGKLKNELRKNEQQRH